LNSRNNEIRKVSLTPPYAVSTIAGSWTGSGGHADNSTGSSATFNGPQGITTDGANLYVADTGNCEIRKVSLTPPYAVTTIAGSTNPAGHADSGTGTSATFTDPAGITTNGTYLYVTDSGNNEIRKISLTPPYAVSTIAGSWTGLGGHVDSNTGTSATFNDPQGITTDGTYLYVVDTSNCEIRKISLASPYPVTTIAGSTNPAGHADSGTGTSASFNFPRNIATDGTNLYVSDTSNYEIRKISLASPFAVTTIAGAFNNPGVTDGNVTSASFDDLEGITIDGTSLYVLDVYGNDIRKIQ
jgi:sugar lactone lactonase YvrE